MRAFNIYSEKHRGFSPAIQKKFFFVKMHSRIQTEQICEKCSVPKKYLNSNLNLCRRPGIEKKVRANAVAFSAHFYGGGGNWTEMVSLSLFRWHLIFAIKLFGQICQDIIVVECNFFSLVEKRLHFVESSRSCIIPGLGLSLVVNNNLIEN